MSNTSVPDQSDLEFTPRCGWCRNPLHQCDCGEWSDLVNQSLQSPNPPSAFWESVQCDLSPLWYGVGHSVHELAQCSPPEQPLQTLHSKDRSHWPEAQWDFQEEAWRLVNQRMRYNGHVDQKHISLYIKSKDILFLSAVPAANLNPEYALLFV